MKLELKDNKNIYYGEKVVLNLNIKLKNPISYDKDILEKLKDITLYINGVKKTVRYPTVTFSNLKPGEYEVYYKIGKYTSNTVKFTVRSLTNWQQLINAVDYAKTQTKDISIGLQEGSYINTGTINWTNRDVVLTIDCNGQTIDGNQQLVFNIGNGASIVLKNITIKKNAKSEHGAILNAGTLSVVGAALANNTATYDGGAIANYGKLTVINSTLTNNTAYNNGGAIKNGNLRADIIGSTFTNNHAAVGGAIFSNGKCNITGNRFTDNTADNKQTIDLHSQRGEQLDSNVYESTDISLKTIELMVKDDQSIFIQDDDVVLNFNIALKSPYYYDKDILERLEDITIYINGVENVTTNYPNYTLSNLKPGEYTVYYKTCNQKSNSVTFKIIDAKEIKLKTWDVEMVKGKTATFSATINYKNTKINYGKVYFEIDGKPLVRRGAILYAPVKNNQADLSCPSSINIALGMHTITAVYVYNNRIIAKDNKTLTIIDDMPKGADDQGKTPSNEDRKEETQHKTTPDSVLEYSSVNYDSAPKTYTVTSASGNQLICKSNLILLEYLNKLFNMTFINGHIKVYIDGKLVFEGNTTDDLTQAIFEIIDDYIGEHEITVEFTDSEGKTNNYKEKIIVE